VDAGVVAVLLNGVGEPAVPPLNAIEGAVERVEELTEPVDVDGVAGGEPPPGVEGVQPLLQVRDPVGGGVSVEELAGGVVPQLLTNVMDLASGVVVAATSGDVCGWSWSRVWLAQVSRFSAAARSRRA
jgi:hypothetical protein